jgi:spore germination protein GerM
MSRGPAVKARLLSAWSVAVALLVTGCGLNTSSAPEPLDEGAVPTHLGGEAEEESAVDTTPVDGQEPVEVWVADGRETDARLVPLVVPVASSPSPGLVLEALVDNLPEDEMSEGQLISDIPSETSINDVAWADEPGDAGAPEEIVVDLSSSFYEAPRSGRGRYAYGQVVLTLVGLDAVSAVSFLQDGEPTRAIDGRGAEIEDGPAVEADYSMLAVTDED